MTTKRTKKEYALLTAKGMAMGAADVVPGVSGGTIAFITGIYDELLGSLKKIGPEALQILFKQGFSAAWAHINGFFLLAVFGGILLSLKTFAALITIALTNEPLLIWGFFSGLIAASVVLLVKQQERWRITDYLAFIVGTAFVVFISVAKPTQLPGDWWMLFLGGFVAICAMILPGISGSFILLLVGLYPVFLAAINDLNFIALASFGAGCISGLLVFSRFLSWLLEKYHQVTIALLVGFLVGSLNVTWPWKEVLTSVVNRHGETVPLEQANVLPARFTEITGQANQLSAVIACAVLGLVLVLGLEWVSKRMAENEQSV
ncbi:DUF368 domain-containing protein [Catenovulum sp. SM1970]|uniref:DUF368 domain-containing protein n=1 Tax=Marinifaba aquimaris TaxID=2741323 RepID=UPI0015721926|nr:DUF368 domain-containing protein [Marinifaba aquimaris]NTS78056.1 DUF368 domain-containing protein [Marinifaba aquimaris]